jgi:ABC-type uncharacterized transport system ATPase subunit
MVDEEIRERVREILVEEASADDPITSREISDRLDNDEVGSFPETRMIIRDILIEDQVPILGANHGYWVAETEEEIQSYLDNLETRITGIAERRFAIKRAAQIWDGDIDTDDDLDIL